MDWLFRNRQTGEITIAQRPNAALIIFLVGAVPRHVFNVAGTAGTVLGIVATAALAFWGVDELWRGVNPFRRMLGVVALTAIALEILL